MAQPEAPSAEQASALRCEPNTTKTVITDKFRRPAVTHVSGYSVAPGSSFTTSRTSAWNETLTSGITKTGSASVSAGGVIASAEASVGVQLADNSSSTSTRSITHSVTVAGSGEQRRYAVFVGRVNWNGYWERRQCNGDGQHYRVVAQGTWRSYRTAEIRGAALCNQGRYAAGTLEARACTEVGWRR